MAIATMAARERQRSGDVLRMDLSSSAIGQVLSSRVSRVTKSLPRSNTAAFVAGSGSGWRCAGGVSC
ncbi:MAG: hypothetical protein ACREEQ_11390, partial [Caulobacteraceae bacterium]